MPHDSEHPTAAHSSLKPPYATLVDMLLARAREQPDHVACTFLTETGDHQLSVTYGYLDRAARVIAARLQAFVAPGERALLVYRPGPDFLPAFMGCIYAGVVAVPVVPPEDARHVARLAGIIKEARARLLLTSSDRIPSIESWLSTSGATDGLRVLSTDTLLSEPDEAWLAPAITSNSIAFLQFTSGSTSAPKGVIVGHGNVLATIYCLQESLGTTAKSISVGWMPHFHDMGLIQGLLLPLFSGFRTYILSPQALLKRPFVWLKAMSDVRATITGGPNFAYDLCVERISAEERATLDLSCVTAAINGAEPVRPASLDRFVRTFAPSGFQPQALTPGYGLAEASLVVSVRRRGRPLVVIEVDTEALEQGRIVAAHGGAGEIAGKPVSRRLVGSGEVCTTMRVVIVDLARRVALPRNHVGELWVSGPSVAQGYWDQPAATAETFGGRLADTGEGPFLRTGDTGFLDADGELFVTGRLKDLIIVGGANHYPHDIEFTAEQSHPALARGNGAAFAVEGDGGDQLHLLYEIRRSWEGPVDAREIFTRVAAAVAAVHGIALRGLTLGRPGSVQKTSSGKIRRGACAELARLGGPTILARWPERAAATAVAVESPSSPRPHGAKAIRDWLVGRLSALCGIPASTIDPGTPLAGYGLSSIGAVGLAGELEALLGRAVESTIVYRCPTIHALAAHLAGEAPASAVERRGSTATGNEPIAIIGLGCRLPGADGPAAFWRLLRSGVHAVTPTPESRWDTASAEGAPGARWGGYLDAVDRFDSDFFGISPREAATMDPQQRLLVEVAWEALEHAGLPPSSLGGQQVGVFVGVSTGDYARLQVDGPSATEAHAATGAALSIVANRLSYFLDLRGPSLAVDTACSSSLVAVHQACQSLRRGECDLGLAGGVSLILSPDLGITFSRAGMMSSDGRCKTFEAAADGYVRGEGCGVVVLKRLCDALADGDTILALIRGSAVNQDGRSNGLTAPSGRAQEEVIGLALRDAGIEPARVGYVEAHGTGTPLGDPIEASALQKALAPGRLPDGTCWVGSVKTNIGHLEAAAGIAGLIKTTLCLSHGEIPPLLHFSVVNPRIPMTSGVIAFPTEAQPWPRGAEPRVAGVSSFGFGGTNAHVLLEEAPASAPAAEAAAPAAHVLVLSARSEPALRELAERYARALEGCDAGSVDDLCFTAATGRDHFDHRLAAVGTSAADLAARLDGAKHDPTDLRRREGRPARRETPRIALLFTGQGSQYAGMGRDLYAHEPVFRQALDRCDALLRRELEVPLLSVLFPGDERSPIDETAFTQPALFALEYACYELWRSWGIVPDRVLGHSVGEYVAAHVAGVFSLEDALRLVAGRARLMQALPRGGAMAAVFAPERQVAAALAPYRAQASIAAVNGPESVVVSGSREAVDAVLARLATEGVESKPLSVSHAFHSPLMEPVLADFTALVQTISFHAPTLPLISNRTGRVADESVTSPAYWVEHLREPVLFSAGIEALGADGVEVFLEIGPQPSLIGLGRRCLPGSTHRWIASLAPGTPDAIQIRCALAALYTAGVPIDWAGVHRGARRRVSAPTYPFQRLRHWFSARSTASSRTRSDHALLGEPLTLAEPAGARVFTQVLDVKAIAYLEDHQIDGTIVFPGAGYVEMALSAAAHLARGGALELGETIFERALILTQPREVQTLLVPDASGVSFVVHSRPVGREDDRTWVRHTAGRVRQVEAGGGGAEPGALEAIRARCRVEEDGGTFYARWRARGNQWGPAFQGLERLRYGDGECLARLRTPEHLADTLGRYTVHPALLDACSQVLAATRPGTTGAFVGKEARALRIHAPFRGDVFYSHAVLCDPGASSRHLEGNIRVFDADERLLAELVGVRFEFLDQAPEALEDPARWTYRVGFRAVELGADPGADEWLIVDHDTDDGRALEAELSAAGHRVTRVSATRPAELEGALVGRPIRRVVDLSGLARAGTEETSAAALEHTQRLISGAVDLSRRLVGARVGARPRLWLATRGAWSLEDRADTVGLASAALWGFGRTLAAEEPEIWGGLIDLDPVGPAGPGGVTPGAALSRLAAEDQVVLRGGVAHVLRLERHAYPRTATPPRFDRGATYLITGGHGGLGLRFARWMVEQGARHLVLMSRAGLPPRRAWRDISGESALASKLRSVLDLEAMGASVLHAAVDVSDEAALARWLSEFRDELRPPLRGVVHAAGTVERTPLVELDATTIEAQLRPKVAGAWALHRLLAADPLDFFVMFSSASAILGSPGLAAYAAANAFLDALAAHRRAIGLPALSINWGPWSDVGLMARGLAERVEPGSFTAMGLIDPDRGVELAGRLWSAPLAQVAVLPIDWPLWRARYPAASTAPMLADVVDAQRAGDEGSAADDRPALDGLAAAAIPGAIAAWLCRRLREALLLPDTEIDVERPITSYGLDSLMAIELRKRIEIGLRVTIPVVDLIRGPSVNELASQLAALVARGADAATPLPTSSGDVEGGSPLSPAQRAQWLLHALQPDGASYHVSFCARVRSALDADAMQRALDALTARHATLRTTYSATGGEVHQVSRSTSSARVVSTDAAGMSAEVLHAAVMAAYRRPFDLERGPILRLELWRTAEDDHVLLLVVHHIACDGRSLWLLLQELGVLYAAEVAGSAASLPSLELSFADAARWQQALVDGPEGDRQWAFWKRSLSGELPVLALPTDLPRPVVPTGGGASVRFSLGGPLTQGLRELARSQNATLYVVLLSAFQAMCHRYTCQDEIVVGSPMAARGRHEFEGIIGNFVNPVVLRGDLRGEPGFDALVRRVRATVLDAIAHQDLPFPVIVERLQSKRDPARSPLFQVSFVLQQPQGSFDLVDVLAGRPGARARWGSLEVEAHELIQQEGQFDLVLELLETSSELVGYLKYSTDIFERASVEQMAAQLGALLRAVVDDPTCPIDRLALSGAAPPHEPATTWCGPALVQRPGICVQQLFEEQAARTPDAPAVSFGDETLSYAELNVAANRLAHHLRALGVKPEVMVGICVERSVDMVVGLLGILKAGGAYVPLDHAYPAARLHFVINEIAAPVLVTHRRCQAHLSGTTARVVHLDDDRAEIAHRPSHNPPIEGSADSLAYVIYTSGSTGAPKGVLVTHTNLVYSTLARVAYYGAPPARFAMVSSFAFDSSIAGIFWTLASGGCLCLQPPSFEKDPLQLAALFQRQRVTHVLCLPTLYALALKSAPAGGLPSLRVVIVAGEPCPPQLLRAHAERMPNATLYNEYGPTEATVWSTVHRCSPDEPRARVSIGQAIPGGSVYVLDKHLQIAPGGAPGELFIGGPGVTRGYLDRAELTAERFIVNPFGAGRLYRTGDRARWLAGGTLEFLGRSDDQVKVRGVRVELGEIEALLVEHAAISAAAVAVREDVPGDARLVAYVVLSGTAVSNEEIRRFLGEKLPEPMVPALVVRLAALPLTSSGKLDRSALPTPEVSRVDLETQLVIPRTEMERTIAAIWEEVLRVNQAGVHDNFFDLGGHSLLLVQCHAKLQEVLSDELTVVDLFAYPTIRSLADHLSQGTPAPAATSGGVERAKARDARGAAKEQLRERRERQRAKGEG